MEAGATVGDNVTIKNNVCVWMGVTLEDDVFVGPNVTFTNDRFPRSGRMPHAGKRYLRREDWLEQTIVERGASIGANATILPGIRVGRYCMVAAGALVTADVPPFALMIGVPARQRRPFVPLRTETARKLPRSDVRTLWRDTTDALFIL